MFDFLDCRVLVSGRPFRPNLESAPPRLRAGAVAFLSAHLLRRLFSHGAAKLFLTGLAWRFLGASIQPLLDIGKPPCNAVLSEAKWTRKAASFYPPRQGHSVFNDANFAQVAVTENFKIRCVAHSERKLSGET
jgi:hypothetical protein